MCLHICPYLLTWSGCLKFGSRRTSVKGWSSREDEYQPYFVLEDLWESLMEWSAYGVGVPLLVDKGSVVQYYAPYLSGIQLFVDRSKTFLKSSLLEVSDDSSWETSSDGISDSETETGPYPFASWRKQEVAKSNLLGMEVLSLRVTPSGYASSSNGTPVFEFFDHDAPFNREPLCEKLSILARHFPQLNTYKSYELSSSSWISLAWYPIYRIPGGKTIENTEAAFLTYHSLSTPIKGWPNAKHFYFGSRPSYCPTDFNMASAMLPLPIFAMGCLKFKISKWEQDGVDESQKVDSLFQTANNWLKRLKAYHPDLRFFITNMQRSR